MPINSQVLLNRMLAKLRIRHIQAMVKLAELGSVNRTAQALGLSQPAITLLLADLERLMDPDGHFKFPHPWPPQIPPGSALRL
jgi:hypothetical protein